MKTHTNNFKEEIKKFGRQIDAKITYEIDGDEIELGAEELGSVSPHYEGSILKSVMKQLDLECNTDIPIGTEINCQFGLKVGNSYEYINFGNYIVYSSEKQEDTHSYKIICYDKILYSMIPYEAMEITYPITIRDYIIAICDKLELEFENEEDEFANYDKEISNELYLDSEGNSLDYTFRDVLDELAQVTGSIICINEDNDKLEIRYINETNDTIDEEYLKDINVNFGEKYGPVNSIVLSRSAESDNVYIQDEESVILNGLCEIKIKDNQIMNFNDRAQYLEDLLDVLDGLEYYVNDFSSTGVTYYDLGDLYNISIGNDTYKCIMLNDEINITQGLEELVHTELLEESETDYTKADKTDRKVNQTWIIANKQEGQIEALTSRTTILENETSNMYTIEQVNDLVQNAETGLTNTFSEAGGNNIFRNTGLWFATSDSSNPYEFWNGVVLKQKEEKASNMSAMLLQNGNVSQEQLVPNGKYTISFKYNKPILLTTAKVYINDTEYVLSATEDTEFIQVIEVSSQHINIKFNCDVDNGCEIYDLMVNAGEVKLAYSQNQNETTTDTVNISKGITITSSDTDVKFKADSDGIRTLDNSNNILTEFTDEGMKTKTAIIENKSTIVGTLWQVVGNQTWITKL